MESFARIFWELRYALRSLQKNPGLAAAAVITLALGIGANTAMFSVLEGVVLDPLPYPDSDRLVLVALFNRTLGTPTYLSYPDFLDWQRGSQSFEQIAAMGNEGFDLTSPGAPEHVDGSEVSSNFFSVLNVRLALGRGFSPEEDRIGGAPAVVISQRLWHDRFGDSPAAVGKSLTLSGVDYTVVGVLASGFRFGNQPADVYTPLARWRPLSSNDRTVHDILCVARLRPEVSVSQALAEMNTVQQHIDELNPTTERGQGAYVVPLKRFVIGDIGDTILLLMGAVGLVLLIACANVVNLLLARSASRTREFAIRLALGATRWQIIVRQHLAESMMLSTAGGLLGLTIAKWGVNAVLAGVPGGVPRGENISVNLPVLLFAFSVSMIVGFVFGLFPALRSTKPDVRGGLKKGGGERRNRRVQHALVVLQVALAFVLLTSGGLLFRTIRNLWALNPGFNPDHILTFQVGLSPAVTKTPPNVRVAYQQLIERIRQIPGIEAADITALVPLSDGSNQGPFWIGPHPPASMAESPRAIYYPTGPDYVRTMQIPLLRGRFLSRTDDLNSEIVVLIDNLLAHRFFPGQDPVGQEITIPHWGAARNITARIVGVVGHVEQSGLDGSAGEKPQIYYSFYQLPDEVVPDFRSEVTVAVRSRIDAASVMPAIRSAVHDAGSDQPVYNLRTMQELVSGSMGRQRFPMLLLAAFAALALLLAVVGIYGVISYSTARRTNEIGIRMALGSGKSAVVRMVVAEGLRLALVGIAIGTVGSLVLTRLFLRFSHLLYGVQASDPITLISVSLTLIGAAGAACYIPARRAASLEPIAALRQE